MEDNIGQNNLRAEKNKLIYYLDYNYLYNKYKNYENKYYYNNFELINNVSSFFLLYGIYYVKDINFVLNSLFTKDCECILNGNKIVTNIFMKLLFVLHKRKYDIPIYNIDNLNITQNKIYNDYITVEFKNKKIVKLNLKNDKLSFIHDKFFKKNMYDLFNLDLTYKFNSSYLESNSHNLEDYFNNLLENYLKIYLTQVYISFKEYKIQDIDFERNIYSLMYLFLFKYNSEYINGFCKLFLKETIIKLNDKDVDMNYYLNLYKRFYESFTKINFNIENIEFIDKQTASVKYNLSCSYVRNYYYLNTESFYIKPENQELITPSETMNIKIDNKGRITELFINSDCEYSGLELVYHKLLELQNSNDLITVEKYRLDLAEQNKLINNTESKDVESKDVEHEDVESKDVESKDVESKDVEHEDVESKDVESKDVESKDVESKDVESKDVESKDVESKDIEHED